MDHAVVHITIEACECTYYVYTKVGQGKDFMHYEQYKLKKKKNKIKPRELNQ